MVCTGKGIEAQQMWVTPVSFPRTNHLKHIHTESSRDEIGKSTLDWGSYWLIIFPSDSLSGWEVQSPKEDAAFSIWEVAVLLGTDCLLPSMSHVAIPQPQLRQAQELSQTYPSFGLWTTLFHGLLNRIPKMLAEQASLYYGLEKSESPRRKPSMNTNRRSLKESFNSSGEWIAFMFLIKSSHLRGNVL